MKKIIEQLYHHETLSTDQAYALLVAISREEIEPIQIASVLTVFIMRPIEVQELLGFQQALLDLAIPFDPQVPDTVDVCGTGGDRKNSFNISTLASFVVAGAGFKVVKHGNYGVSSLCGSSNVLEQLGLVFTNEPVKLHKALEHANICFLHAPLFHPAMKAVAPIRRSLAVRTFFNMLGPLVNPAKPNRQLTGVFNLDIARKYRSIQSRYDRNFMVIHSLDGYDEISLTGPAKYFSNYGEGILHTEVFGSDWLQVQDIEGGSTVKQAADIFMNVLSGKGTEAQQMVVLANAALAIHCFDFERSIPDCMEIARESLESGRAKKSFTELIHQMS